MENKKKHIIGLLVAFCLVLAAVVPTGIFASSKSKDIVILYTNDIHAHIDGQLSYDVLAGMKKELKKKYKYVILADAGDHVQGTAYGSIDNGKSIIHMMNATGYDVATLGDKEFTYGMETRRKITKNWADFDYISCNFTEEYEGVTYGTVLPKTKTFKNLGKWDVTFVGITSPASINASTSSYFSDDEGSVYRISEGKDLYEDVQDAIGNPGKEDIVIALGHLGSGISNVPNTSEAVIQNTSGLDVFIDGHSHDLTEGKSVADKEGNQVLLTQGGEYFEQVGMMIIDAKSGAITNHIISAEDAAKTYDEDNDVESMKETLIESWDKQLGKNIGKTTVTFNNYDVEGNRLVRKQATNVGALAADALYNLFDSMDLSVDVAIVNGGNIKNKAIAKGNITYETCKEIHSSDSIACLQEVTGQQLLDALEWGARNYPEESSGFIHVSGLTYDIDTSIESTVRATNKGNWAARPAGEYRVKNVMIYSKETFEYTPLDLDETYNVAGYNHLLCDYDDGFTMFKGSRTVIDDVMEGYLVLAEYIKTFPANKVTKVSVITATNSDYSEVYDDSRIGFFCGHRGAALFGVKEATCLAAGYTGDGICNLCDEEVVGETIIPLGHDFKDGVCTICKQKDTLDDEVVKAWELYQGLQRTMATKDVDILEPVYDAFLAEFEGLTRKQERAFSSYVEDMGYDIEEVSDQMFNDTAVCKMIIDDLGDIYDDFKKKDSKKNARALVKYYEEKILGYGFISDDFEGFFGIGELESAYEDALKKIGRTVETEAESAEDIDTYSIGPSGYAAIAIGLVIVMLIGLIVIRLRKEPKGEVSN